MPTQVLAGHSNQGIEAPWSGHPKYNFHANDIDFQIEADFIGLMCPGLPRESNKYCDRVGRVMNYGDGLYGGMFVCGMYAAAYFQNDPREVVAAGLACIPADSEYGRLIQDLLDWSAQHPDDWRKVWQLVEDKWDVHDPCPDGFQADFNIDAKLNGAYIAFGLLFGGGDFEKTMEISTRCGQDSDCNPSSAAGVLGVMLGYRSDSREVRGRTAVPRKPQVRLHRLFLQRNRGVDRGARAADDRHDRWPGHGCRGGHSVADAGGASPGTVDARHPRSPHRRGRRRVELVGPVEKEGGSRSPRQPAAKPRSSSRASPWPCWAVLNQSGGRAEV